MSDGIQADIEALGDLCTPWCIRVAVTLRIPELIREGNNSGVSLAEMAGCDPDYLRGVLSQLAARGVLLEPSPGNFELNEVSRKLLEPEARFGYDLFGLGGRMSHAWGTLLTLVRTGSPGYKERFGLPFWEDLESNKSLGDEFDELIGPSGHGMPRPDFELDGGWDSIRSVVDVGGGTGAMLAGILCKRPHLSGILVDVPRACSKATVIFDNANVSDRARISAQSFFDPLPPDCDLYLLRGILNDWPDDESVLILKQCRDANPKGRIVILKSVGPETMTRGIFIEMLLLGGRQRTISQFAKLAALAGLEIVRHGNEPAGYLVECRSAGPL